MAIRPAMPNQKSIQEVYDSFWKAIIEKDGVIDMAKLKEELAEFSYIMEQASIVYSAITNGAIKKANARSSDVLRAAKA